MPVELHEAWFTLIQKVEEENPLLKKNIALVLMKLVDNSHHKKQFFPLHVVSGFADLHLVKFIIGNNLVEILSKKCENRVTPIQLAVNYGHTEIVKALIGSTDNPNAPDNVGITPYQRAKNNNHLHVMNLFSRKRKRIVPDRECKRNKYF